MDSAPPPNPSQFAPAKSAIVASSSTYTAARASVAAFVLVRRARLASRRRVPRESSSRTCSIVRDAPSPVRARAICVFTRIPSVSRQSFPSSPRVARASSLDARRREYEASRLRKLCFFASFASLASRAPPRTPSRPRRARSARRVAVAVVSRSPRSRVLASSRLVVAMCRRASSSSSSSSSDVDRSSRADRRFGPPRVVRVRRGRVSIRRGGGSGRPRRSRRSRPTDRDVDRFDARTTMRARVGRRHRATRRNDGERRARESRQGVRVRVRTRDRGVRRRRGMRARRRTRGDDAGARATGVDAREGRGGDGGRD